jgi:tetratricopeptide (TPR) repeat protein
MIEKHKARFIAARDSGDTNRAISALLDCLAEEPDVAVIHASLALEYAKSGEPLKAEQSAHRALELAPELWLAHYSHAVSLTQQRRFEEAQGANNRALEFEPDNEAILDVGVRIAEFRKDDATVEKMTERFLYAAPSAPAAHVAFGNLLYRRGQTGAARAAALRALEYDPECANAHMLLALIDLELQRHDAAEASVNTVLRINPHHALAQSVAKRLRGSRITILKSFGASTSPKVLLMLAMAGVLSSGMSFSLLPLYFGELDTKWLLLFCGTLVLWPLLRLETNLRTELPSRETIYLSSSY